MREKLLKHGRVVSLDQSNGKKISDVDRIDFLTPGKGVTNEHPIPDSWQSANGYKNPTGSFAKFDNTFSLSRTYLNPGESGCPQGAGHCRYTESFFKGGANLNANLQGFGSIENIVVGAQSVTINAKANRITTFKVNDDPVFSEQINGSASSFSLEEEKVDSVTPFFRLGEDGASIGSTVQWNGAGDTATLDASYVQRIVMPDFVNVGFSDQFLVEVRDDPGQTH